jgi:hypothetical protein
VDFINALRMLRRRWWWAAIGVIPVAYLALSSAYHVGTSGIHKKSLEFGSAQTQLLIDSPESTLAYAGADVTPLSTRAQVFAQFLQTNPVKTEMGKLLHVPGGAIAVTIPNTNPNLPIAAIQPAAQQRNQGLISESKALQLLVVPEPDLPLISVYAQGPTSEAATALANASAKALGDYVAGLRGQTFTKKQLNQQARLGIVPASRVTVRQLGAAQGGMVDSGASKKVAILVFFGLLILDCVIVILLGGFVDRLRTRNQFEATVAVAHE